MNFFLYEKYSLITTLTKEEILFRLNENIDSRNYFKRLYSGDKAYEGFIVGNNFEMKVISPGKNPFKAVIEGTIFNMNDNSIRIKIVLKMFEVGIVFVSLILLALFGIIFTVIKDLINHATQKDDITALVVFVVLLIFSTGIYKLQSNYLKTFIKTLLEAAEIK